MPEKSDWRFEYDSAWIPKENQWGKKTETCVKSSHQVGIDDGV